MVCDECEKDWWERESWNKQAKHLSSIRVPLDSPEISTHDVDGNNLSVGLLDLLQLTEVVPETRLGDNIVGRKDSHAARVGQSMLGLDEM
jgi:hypothetical protein